MEVRNIEVPLYYFLKINTHKLFQTDSSPQRVSSRVPSPRRNACLGGYYCRKHPLYTSQTTELWTFKTSYVDYLKYLHRTTHFKTIQNNWQAYLLHVPKDLLSYVMFLPLPTMWILSFIWNTSYDLSLACLNRHHRKYLYWPMLLKLHCNKNRSIFLSSMTCRQKRMHWFRAHLTIFCCSGVKPFTNLFIVKTTWKRGRFPLAKWCMMCVYFFFPQINK